METQVLWNFVLQRFTAILEFSKLNFVQIWVDACLDRDIPTMDLPPTPYPATGASGGLVRGASPCQGLSTPHETRHRIDDK